MTEKQPMPDVRVGQVWRDNDPRSRRRHIKVVMVTARHGWSYVLVRNVITGRQTTIRQDRFRPTKTGYVLTQDVS